MKNLIKQSEEILNKIQHKEFLSNKSIMIEQVESQKCSKQEANNISFIFTNNPQVKYKYRNGIENTLKRVFKDYYKSEPGKPAGIYDFESEGWSVLNKLNTNYYCFCILMKDINVLLKKQGMKTIDLIGLTPQEQLNEVEMMMEIINVYGERIFNPESKTFKNLMSSLSFTHSRGESTENKVVKKLKDFFGEKNVKKIGELGSMQDMVKGVDIIFKLDDQELTGQIKPYSSIEKVDGKIIFKETGLVKKYSTDWLIFSKGDNVYIMDNQKTKIENGNFVFPESSIVYSL